ncbi:hypothetical protein [uncultured Phenylobacterium sp.]|uniref:hypothetical protein n=1 Tax=uncultured Phenylobacterium sp. TaxID=349273 RepID=UPI0025DD1F9D|nr:hypothetical protein [uncultured Phenylobacterium sp.]
MSSDKKPQDQITAAGAVELDETQLDGATGGLLPAVQPAELKADDNPTTLSPTFYEAWPQKHRG